MSRPSNLSLLCLTTCASVALAGMTLWASSSSTVDTRALTEPLAQGESFDAGGPSPLACVFSAGERRAYDLRSLAGIAGTVDRFEGQLSLEVVEASADGALMRAAFTSVALTQALTYDHERTDASALEAAPFFLRTDDRCRFLALGFASSWSTASRQLVSTVLLANEIVLPGDLSLRWEATQRDGSGEYLARYAATMTEGGASLIRHKQLATASGGELNLGFDLTIMAARTEAVFDRAAGAMQRVRGEEQVRLSLPGSPAQTLTHSFSMTRRDAGFVEVASAAPSAADFRDAFALEGDAADAAVDHSIEKMSADEARAQFLAFFEARGADGVLPAARFLSQWLRLHPEEARALMDALREGKIAKRAHAALFLGFELAGSDATRDVLVTALQDAELSELNRARAASALADHGAPTAQTVDHLLKHAREDQSAMVATVSRLGLGSMAKRADGALGDRLHTLLGAELASAPDRASVVMAIDAIGNSADDRFAPALVEHLDAPEPSVRAHAAEAMGRLTPEVSREALVARLATEHDPQVIAATLRGLCALDERDPQLSTPELALATRLLDAPHMGVRGLVIAWLGRSAAHLEVRLVLATHFRREPDPRLKQLIGRFVSAAELRRL